MSLSAITREPTRESLRLFAALALSAYQCGPGDWPGCSIRHISDEPSGMRAVVIADAHAIVISVAGTEPHDWRDWLRDASVRLVSCPFGGRVHQGFWAGWKVLQRQIEDAIWGLDYYDQTLTESTGRQVPSRPLYITGHSMGGAVATLAHDHFHSDLCVTFGSPRVVDFELAKLINRTSRHKLLRVTHGNDIVPRLPLPIEYRHCGTHVLLDRKDRIRIDPSYWTIGVDRVLGFKFDLIRDHLLGRYLESLS